MLQPENLAVWWYG